MDDDLDVVTVAGQRFVDGVVQHFEHHVVQTGAILSVANIHAGAFAYRFQAFRILMLFRIVGGVGIRYRFLVSHLRCRTASVYRGCFGRGLLPPEWTNRENPPVSPVNGWIRSALA